MKIETMEQRFQRYMKAMKHADTTVSRMAWFASAFEILHVVTAEIATLPPSEGSEKLQRLADETKLACESLATFAREN